MRFRALALFPFLAVASSLCATGPQAETQKLTAPGLPQFLADFEKGLAPLDSAFDDLENAKLSLLDEGRHPLGPRNIQDRRTTLSDIPDTVKQVQASQQVLVLT